MTNYTCDIVGGWCVSTVFWRKQRWEIERTAVCVDKVYGQERVKFLLLWTFLEGAPKTSE